MFDKFFIIVKAQQTFETVENAISRFLNIVSNLPIILCRRRSLCHRFVLLLSYKRFVFASWEINGDFRQSESCRERLKDTRTELELVNPSERLQLAPSM